MVVDTDEVMVFVAVIVTASEGPQSDGRVVAMIVGGARKLSDKVTAVSLLLKLLTSGDKESIGAGDVTVVPNIKLKNINNRRMLLLWLLLISNRSVIYTVIVVLWLLLTSGDQHDDGVGGVAVVVADIKPICNLYSDCDCC